MKFKIALIALFIQIVSCKPDKGRLPAVCDNTTTVKCPEDAVSKFYFADSSYWIYRDSQTMQLDSVWVDESLHETFNRYWGNILYERCYERFRNIIFSKLNGRGVISIGPVNVNDEAQVYEDEGFTIDVMMSLNSDRPVTRFSFKGNKYKNPGYYGETLTFSDSIKLINNVYRDIIHQIYPQSGPDIISEAWYADSVGLIKYKMQNNSVWELIRYKVYK